MGNTPSNDGRSSNGGGAAAATKLVTTALAPSSSSEGFRLVQVGPSGDPHAMRLRIFMVSDTHGAHRSLQLPESADVFVHAGDHSNWKTSERDTRDFNCWLGEIKDRFPVRLVCCGNHELHLAKATTPEARARKLSNATYLEGESITVGNGIVLFFAPWTPSRNFTYRANAFQRGKHQMKELLQACPENIDVLVSHCPPLGILDTHKKGHSMGSEQVLRCVERVVPPVHIFGHCHDSSGIVKGNVDRRCSDRHSYSKGDSAAAHQSPKGKTVSGGSVTIESKTEGARWTCSYCMTTNPSMYLMCDACQLSKSTVEAPHEGLLRRSMVRSALCYRDGLVKKTPAQQQEIKESSSNSVVFVNASNRHGEMPILLDVYYYPATARKYSLGSLRPGGEPLLI